MGPTIRARRAIRVGGRFLVVGAVSTAIEVAAFNLLLWAGWDVVAAKVLSSLIALVNAYIGNRLWTFGQRARGNRTREIVLFIVVNAACTALGAVLVWAGAAAWQQAAGSAPGAGILNVVNLVSIVIVVVVRGAAYHWAVFPSRAAPRDRDRLVG
jgi:putative flippase GtrA